jgi:hypothetical protein
VGHPHRPRPREAPGRVDTAFYSCPPAVPSSIAPAAAAAAVAARPAQAPAPLVRGGGGGHRVERRHAPTTDAHGWGLYTFANPLDP